MPPRLVISRQGETISTFEFNDKKILIAEDDLSNYYFLFESLKETGVEIIWAKDGEETMELFREHSDLNLVLMDINMPGMNGIELVQWMRTERKLEVPIVVLSSRCDQESLVQTLLDHKVAVYPKPFSPSQLVARIEELLGRFAC